jgi:hypothetical protein
MPSHVKERREDMQGIGKKVLEVAMNDEDMDKLNKL